MTIFYSYTIAIALIIGLSIWTGVRGQRDSLHPALVLGAMALFLYVLMPLKIAAEDGFFGYLTERQLVFGQLVNLVGIAALVLGVAIGAYGGTFREGFVRLLPEGPRVYNAAIIVGLAGVWGYGAGILAMGGFSRAYGVAYGGGWSDSGYVRELYLMTSPAILLLLASGRVVGSIQSWTWVALFGAPLAIQGLLGARRGPTFVVLVTILAGVYLIRGRRPLLLQVLGGGAAVGVLLLLLVANRQNIYIGSEFRLEGDPTEVLSAGSGNEFIYGAGSVYTASETGQYYWGGRYATVLFIRPIPRSIWPEKYEFAKKTFGADVEVNMGVDIDAMTHIMGWVGAFGAATGIVADMFIEFSWGMVAVMFGLGYFYGRSWRNSVTKGGIWIVVYGVALALSIYLIMQSLEAFLFRVLFMLAPVGWVWWYAGLGRFENAEPEGGARSPA
ncbi:MAG: hypothetical protein QM704_03955 [Anaeromyxobacteraceae bacterium]